MAEAVMGFTIIKPNIHSFIHTTKLEANPCSRLPRHCSGTGLFNGWQQLEGKKSRRSSLCKANALPDWPLMAVMVEHMDGQRDLITHKFVWHLSDQAIKNDPFYDSEQYRGDGGDGTGNWVYEKQDDIEESSRAELWREELIEEIEQKVGGLRELEEAGKKEELTK
ncbi:photosynthetic ndh subunit of subcomplex b 4 [Quercus suber]|uniref:Photosynthetic ndh subunit of subcomplex b 4 n=1 Tax=Quercus suber TaxID=58331 RepID=A0AAW0IXG9_QUESU